MTSASPRIILTGGSRGLGLAILRILLARYNARVAVLSRSLPEELQSIVTQHGQDRVLVAQGDIGDPGDNDQVVNRTVQAWGGVDGLVLNAGQLEPVGKLADLPQSALTPYVQTNLLSSIYLIQAALPHLRRKTAEAEHGPGRIVYVSSGAATTGYVGWGLYSMVKAAGNSLCRTLAAEEKENNVAIWSVRPGVINTDMQAVIREKGPGVMTPAEMEKFKGLYERGELLDPEVPGSVIAGMVVEGSADLSGEFLNWSDERLSAFQLKG